MLRFEITRVLASSDGVILTGNVGTNSMIAPLTLIEAADMAERLKAAVICSRNWSELKSGKNTYVIGNDDTYISEKTIKEIESTGINYSDYHSR